MEKFAELGENILSMKAVLEEKIDVWYSTPEGKQNFKHFSKTKNKETCYS